jgi:lipoyl(octanoyl) transferase
MTHPLYPQLSSRTRPSIDWRVELSPVDYPAAVAAMEQRAAEIAAGNAAELVWLLEHPAIYTAGTSANAKDLIEPDRFPVFNTGRGGQYTYHGPGQRVAYTMLNLQQRGGDVRCFVQNLERWLIDTLATFGVSGAVREGRVGVWVDRTVNGAPQEDKIAALGIRVRRGISFHGVSINIAPDLNHFSGIVACGISQHGVTSLRDLGCTTSFSSVDAALRDNFEPIFGPTTLVQT